MKNSQNLRWWTFTGRDCHSITFCTDDNNKEEDRALDILNSFEEATLREATEREKKSALYDYKHDPYAIVRLEEIVDKDILPFLTLRMMW